VVLYKINCMRLFEFKNWKLYVAEEAWGLTAFKKILDRDKSKEKEIANKEMLFLYFYCDVKSDYLSMDKLIRESEIKRDIGLPDKWKIDSVIKKAIALYTKHYTVIEKLYIQSLKSATDIGNYLERTAELLEERDKMGKPVTDIAKITMANSRMPKLMSDLKASYKEVVKEQLNNENKKKGARSFNMYEDGL